MPNNLFFDTIILSKPVDLNFLKTILKAGKSGKNQDITP